MGIIRMILNEVAEVEAWKQRGPGADLYEAPRLVRCRVVGKSRRVTRLVEGSVQECRGDYLMYCEPGEAERIPLGSRVRRGGQLRTVVEVQPVMGLMGAHTEIVLA